MGKKVENQPLSRFTWSWEETARKVLKSVFKDSEMENEVLSTVMSNFQHHHCAAATREQSEQRGPTWIDPQKNTCY